MTRKSINPWLKVPYPAISWEGAELAEVDPAYVPIILADLEPRKVRNLWTDGSSWEAGYDGICKTQEALLMGAKEDIIIEIRGTRAGPPYDLETVPVGTYMGANQEAILGALGGPFANLDVQLTVIRGILEEIRDNGGLASEGQLDALLQIVALLTV